MAAILLTTKRLYFAIFASYIFPRYLRFIAIGYHFPRYTGRLAHSPRPPPPSRGKKKNSRWMASGHLRQFVRSGAFHLRDTLKFMFTLVSSSHDYLPSTRTQESLCESFIWHENGKEKKRKDVGAEANLPWEAEGSQSVGQVHITFVFAGRMGANK